MVRRLAYTRAAEGASSLDKPIQLWSGSLASRGRQPGAAVSTWFFFASKFFISFLFSRLFPEEEVGGQEGGENYGDYAVHGEESGIEAREIVGLDEGMFVEEEKNDGE